MLKTRPPYAPEFRRQIVELEHHPTERDHPSDEDARENKG